MDFSYEIGIDEAGEKWDGTHFARPCQFVYEYLEQTNDKVYCSCKEGVRKYV